MIAAKKMIFTILFFKTLIVFGQNNNRKPCQIQLDTLTKLSVYLEPDEMASFPGGLMQLSKEIHNRMIYPSVLRTKFPDGFKVVVAFVVQQDGAIIGERAIISIEGTDVAERLLDVLNDFHWEPAKCNGKAVSTIVLFPLNVP